MIHICSGQTEIPLRNKEWEFPSLQSSIQHSLFPIKLLLSFHFLSLYYFSFLFFFLLRSFSLWALFFTFLPLCIYLFSSYILWIIRSSLSDQQYPNLPISLFFFTHFSFSTPLPHTHYTHTHYTQKDKKKKKKKEKPWVNILTVWFLLRWGKWWVKNMCVFLVDRENSLEFLFFN